MGSDKMIYWLGRFSFLLGFIMSKKRERLHPELLLEDKITNLFHIIKETKIARIGMFRLI